MAKYKIYTNPYGEAYQGEPKQYMGVISVPSSVKDVERYIENNGYGESYNWNAVKVTSKPIRKGRKKVVKKRTSSKRIVKKVSRAKWLAGVKFFNDRGYKVVKK